MICVIGTAQDRRKSCDWYWHEDKSGSDSADEDAWLKSLELEDN